MHATARWYLASENGQGPYPTTPKCPLTRRTTCDASYDAKKRQRCAAVLHPQHGASPQHDKPPKFKLRIPTLSLDASPMCQGIPRRRSERNLRPCHAATCNLNSRVYVYCVEIHSEKIQPTGLTRKRKFRIERTPSPGHRSCPTERSWK